MSEPGGSHENMRRFAIILLATLTLSAYGRQISPEEAAVIASEFFNSKSAQVAQPKQSTVKRAKAKGQVSENVTAPYYVFNNGDDQGFVIISGDDRAKKILGYSDTGTFDCDNMPPQLAAMLDRYSEQIGETSGSYATDNSWSKISRKSSLEGVLLPTANWDQGAPYNALCPEFAGVKAPTGCVATAMAIVMKYNKWPQEYNWEAMPTENPTSENSVEIAKLMKDAGEAVHMGYGQYESSANMNWVGHRLQQVFHYSPEVQYITQQNFSPEEWTRMIRENLDKQSPIIYSADSGSIGHAFVIDGYTPDEMYHINWGWGGMYNGHYALDSLTPSDGQSFTNNAGMVINITPATSGKVYSTVFCDYGYFWATGGMCPGSHFSIDSPGKDDKFDYSCSTLSYPCNENGQIGLLLYDKNGNEKEVLNSRVFTEQLDPGSGIWSNDVTFYDNIITTEPLPDDYITLATRKSLSHPWVEVLGTIEAPCKMKVSDIRKDVSELTIINNVPGALVSYYGSNSQWVQLENSIECVKGSTFSMFVADEKGNQLNNITIKVEGEGLYGDIEMFYDSRVAIGLYDNKYIITIDENVEGIKKTVELTEAGSLSEALTDTPLSNIDHLTIMGNINAQDLWFIRDNIKTLKALDISQCRIMACEATDPVEAFRISGSEHIEDALPTYALTGLAKLGSVKLPKSLIYIESNSLMSLAIDQIEIPATVQSIGLNVFFDCPNLSTVISRITEPPFINECVFTNTQCPASGVLYVPKGSAQIYKSINVWQDFAQIIEGDGPSANNDPILYEGLKYRAHGSALYLIGYEQSQLPESVIIPDKILINNNEYSVLGIDDNAMQNSDMKTFVMSNSITTIGSFLFSGSTVVKVVMSDNITTLPFLCIDGNNIEELHLPENATSICNSLSCPSLKTLHLPKSLHSERGYNGSIGLNFRNLENITVDPENEEWSVHNGMLFWNGLSSLILVPNVFTGELIIPDETTSINGIEYCDNITEIKFGSGIKSLHFHGIAECANLKHIEFNKDIIFSSNNVIHILPHLESLTMRDFVWASDNCFGDLGSLKFVYLLNENPVNFSGSFYEYVNPEHDYFTPSLNPQVSVPDGSKIYVPGSVKKSHGGGNDLVEMWSYRINRKDGLIQVYPLIDGIQIDKVTINGVEGSPIESGIYKIGGTDDLPLDVKVDFTLHGRQPMQTHYTPEFNADLPDSLIESSCESIVADNEPTVDIFNVQGMCVRRGVLPDDLNSLPEGLYIIQNKKILIKK